MIAAQHMQVHAHSGITSAFVSRLVVLAHVLAKATGKSVQRQLAVAWL